MCRSGGHCSSVMASATLLPTSPKRSMSLRLLTPATPPVVTGVRSPAAGFKHIASPERPVSCTDSLVPSVMSSPTKTAYMQTSSPRDALGRGTLQPPKWPRSNSGSAAGPCTLAAAATAAMGRSPGAQQQPQKQQLVQADTPTKGWSGSQQLQAQVRQFAQVDMPAKVRLGEDPLHSSDRCGRSTSPSCGGSLAGKRAWLLSTPSSARPGGGCSASARSPGCHSNRALSRSPSPSGARSIRSCGDSSNCHMASATSSPSPSLRRPSVLQQGLQWSWGTVPARASACLWSPPPACGSSGRRTVGSTVKMASHASSAVLASPKLPLSPITMSPPTAMTARTSQRLPPNVSCRRGTLLDQHWEIRSSLPHVFRIDLQQQLVQELTPGVPGAACRGNSRGLSPARVCSPTRVCSPAQTPARPQLPTGARTGVVQLRSCTRSGEGNHLDLLSDSQLSVPSRSTSQQALTPPSLPSKSTAQTMRPPGLLADSDEAMYELPKRREDGRNPTADRQAVMDEVNL